MAEPDEGEEDGESSAGWFGQEDFTVTTILAIVVVFAIIPTVLIVLIGYMPVISGFVALSAVPVLWYVLRERRRLANGEDSVTPSRRRYISQAGVFAVSSLLLGAAGFTLGRQFGQESGFEEGYQEGWREFAEPSRLGSPEAEDQEITVTLPEGEFHQIELEPERESLVNIVFLSNSLFDLIVFDHENFQQYQNDGNPDHLFLKSNLATSNVSMDIELGGGHYHIVIDNTSYGDADPVDDLPVSGGITMWTKRNRH